MKPICGRISEQYYPFKREIANWNFEKLTGIGKKSTSERYAILELNVYRFIDYPENGKISISYKHIVSNDSYIVWKISESQFPKEVYDYGKNELISSAEAVVNSFSAIKEQKLTLVFEIIWAGYSLNDLWGKGVVNIAFANAILSCFDESLFQKGLKSKMRHPLVDGVHHSRYQR